MWAQQLVTPHRFEQVEVAAPSASDLEQDQVLLRTLAGGICGSDLPYLRGHLPLPWGPAGNAPVEAAPGFPMHEVVGEVVASRSDELRVGTRVVGWATSLNALAEYVITSTAGVVRYDDTLPPSTAIMLQPLACVLNALDRLPSLEGRDVVVFGLGPIGLLFGHAAKSRGARRVRGVDRVERTELGAKFGIDETIQAATDAWTRALEDADRPDIVIEAIGHQQSTLGHAIDAVRPEGTIYYFGVPDDLHYTVPFQSLVRKNLTLMAGTTPRKQEALASAIDYLARFPELSELYVTNRFPPSQADRAYEMAASPSKGRVKVVIEMA